MYTEDCWTVCNACATPWILKWYKMTGSLEEGDKLESEKNVNPNRKITVITVRNIKLVKVTRS